jgi:hypothetical protein
MIFVEAIQANDVINATAAASGWQRSRRYILQATVTTSLSQFLRNDRETRKSAELCKNVQSLKWLKNTYISKLFYGITGENLRFLKIFRTVWDNLCWLSAN